MIDAYIEEERLSYESKVAVAESHRSMEDEVKRLAGLWNGGIYTSFSDNYVGAHVNIYLGEDDTIEETVNLFLDEVTYELVQVEEPVGCTWIRYEYKTQDNLRLHIFVHFMGSASCKMVETGEFKPILKRVCV